MTAKQKANQARFKKVVAEAKKLRVKNPKLTQAQAVKQAWAIFKKSGKVGEYHKDTKSHNVNIKVVSGWKKGKTKFFEKGEKAPVKKTFQVMRKKTGTFSRFKRIAGVNKIKDTKVLNEIAKENPLKKNVVMIIKRMLPDYDNNLQSLLDDIMRGGLASGIISELIYYTDTIKWYKKYKKYIQARLYEFMQETDEYDPAQLFRSNWDKDDPFANDTSNQNLLAWFSFEDVVYEIQSRLDY